MIFYKEPQPNGDFKYFAFDESNEADIAQYIKPEWVRIDALPEPPTPDPAIAAKDAIRAQIKQLESEQLMPRATREFMLLTMEGMATPEQLAANFGYAAVKAFDAQIEALRDQLV